ncbi:hypothetical protein [Zobellia roscoffensis]|uniref:hypothetical protein n=1 Tax=Zobellia roscoffensis TaxID=2779508 RepID=UPI00188A9584|nr:hypothetical protein [Zobellia roscoffensis]
MSQYIKHLGDEFKKLDWSDSVECIIVFGSLINIPSLTKNKDIDLCFVLKNRDELVLNNLRGYVKERFITPDLTIYYKDELLGNMPFRDIGNGIFALEYFALGKTIFGSNIFIDLFTNASKEEYKKSLVDKIFDYILRIRREHIILEEKLARREYLNKYLIRLVIDILIFLEIETLENLSKLNFKKDNEILRIAYNNDIIKIDDVGILNKHFNNFEYGFLYNLYIQLSNNIETILEKPMPNNGYK